MGDVGDFWRDVNEHRRQQRRREAPRRAKQADDCIKDLVARGHDVVRFSEHHYRVDDAFDFWPTTGRWKSVDGKTTGFMLKPLLKALEGKGKRR